MANSAGTTVTLSGPSTLKPGEQGTFTLTATKLGVPSSARVGLDVAASDGTLAAAGGGTQLLSGEITHFSPQTDIGGAYTYTFLWTMPNDAAAGSTHALYAVAAVGRFGSEVSSWNHASPLTVTTPIPPAPPRRQAAR